MKDKIIKFFSLICLASLMTICKIIFPKERTTEEMFKTFKREYKKF